MTDGRPIRLIIQFSLPLLLSNALQLMYTIADSAVLGRVLGVYAFASVGASVSMHWLVLSAIMGLTIGFGTLMAQRFGAGDADGLRKSFVSSAYLSAAFSLVIGCAGITWCGSALRLLNTPPELVDGATLYLRCFFAGIPVTFAYNLVGSTLFALGDSKTPMIGMMFSSVLNIVFDFALVIPFGIAGVAIATPLAQCAALIYSAAVLRKTGALKGCGFKWDPASAAALLRLGLPLFFRNAVIEVGGLVVQRYVNNYGTEFVAGIAAAKRMYALLMIAGSAVEAGVATFIAQNFGAGLINRVKQGVRDGMLLMCVSVAVIMAFVLPLGRSILSLLIAGPPEQIAAVLDAGARQLTYLTLGLPVVYLLFLYRSALQGIGNTLIPMLSGFMELLMRVVSVVLLTPALGEAGVLISDPAGWLAAAALLSVSYYIIYKKKKTARV